MEKNYCADCNELILESGGCSNNCNRADETGDYVCQAFWKKKKCDDCIAGHCDECQANLCTDCTDYDKEEDEDENKMQVEKVLFLICGHTSCNAFIAVGDVWDCCRPCTTLNGIREEQQRLTIQSQLEKDDAIVLKTVLSEFKLELLKRSLSAWFVSCTISQDITTAAPTNKRLKIDE